MIGISKKRLEEIAEDYPPDHRNHRMSKYLIATECQELNPWMTLEEFLKSGSIGLCLVFCKNRVIVLNYDGKFFINPWVNYPYHTEHITHVKPIHRPEPPR